MFLYPFPFQQGGCLVTLSGAMYLKWAWTRVKLCNYLESRFHFRYARQLFAGFAGMITGILAIVWSYPFLLDNHINAWQQILVASTNGVQACEILHFGLHVIIGVAVCIGCGILGGCCFPMLNAGVCLGVGISCSFFPMRLSVPCSMASCLTGFVPAPFAMVLTISLIFDLDNNQSTSVLIAGLASYTVTGGLGGLRQLGDCAWRITRDIDAVTDSYHRLEVEPEYGESAGGRRPSFEIRNEIGARIFGAAKADDSARLVS
jgi:H+/Cl- antiporter ClcA